MKMTLSELLDNFNTARDRLAFTNSKVREAKADFDQAEQALKQAEQERKSAQHAVKRFGEQLKDALPGYIAGATSSEKERTPPCEDATVDP